MLMALIIAGFVGCGPPEAEKAGSDHLKRVWRASTDNGDKPGNGIEITKSGSGLLGKFFLLDPDKPHDFTAGTALELRMVPRNDRVFECSVILDNAFTDRFLLKLPRSFPAKEFVGVVDSAEFDGGSIVQFTFRQVE